MSTPPPREPQTAAASALSSEAGQSMPAGGKGRRDAHDRELTIAACERAIARNPRDHAAWIALGCASLASKQAVQAATCFEQALSLCPDHAGCWHDLGKARFKLGLIDDALLAFQQSLRLGGGFPPLTAMATVVPGSPRVDNSTVMKIRQRWAQDHLPPADASKQWPPPARPDGRLRIGYLSSFFGWRNWMKPVWALINHHDRDRFEVHLLSDAPREACGQSYRDHPQDRFHDITALSNREAARHIEGQQLDLLIDLNGFSHVDRLAVLALQPAPRIIGWFNHFATTGMPHYHALIGDAHVIPPAEEAHYGERIMRVGGSYLTFEVAYPVPDVASPPVTRSAHLTFGSLASLHKITPEVVAAWSSILQQTPGTTLLFRNSSLSSDANRAFLANRFAAQGITPDRLILEGPAEHSEFLATYDRIDIALDTFPYNGGTTTTEALWQGVPIITFPGDRWVSRTSTSILREAGLSEFVADDLPGYVALAVQIAHADDTPARLADLRAAMRTRLQRSSVCDTPAFARRMETLYESLVEAGTYR